jgi:hypothetical protein
LSSFRVVGGKPSKLEQRLYICSRDITAEKMAKALRAHCDLGNRLHRMVDVNFGSDGCQVRKDNTPQNLSLLKKIVLNLIRSDNKQRRSTACNLESGGHAGFAECPFLDGRPLGIDLGKAVDANFRDPTFL